MLPCPAVDAFAPTDAILQKTNRVARRVLRPLGYKMLEVQGLNPASVNPAAARAALQADLNPQQQAAVDAEAERLFKEVRACGATDIFVVRWHAQAAVGTVDAAVAGSS